MSTITGSIIGHAAIGAIIPWVTIFASGQFTTSNTTIWSIIAIIAAIIGYLLSFGLGVAIHNDCKDTNLTNTALWSLVTPVLSLIVIALITLFPIFRNIVESVILQYKVDASQTLLIGAVASYYLLWCFAIGGAVSGYESKVCAK